MKIMIVDDEKELLEAIKIIIESSYTEVTIHYSSIDALKENIFDFDLIVSDFSMRPMNGIDFLKEIHIKNPNVKLILATCWDSIDDLPNYIEMIDKVNLILKLEEIVKIKN